MTQSTRGNDHGFLGLAAALFGLAMLASCDVPEAPEWEIQTTLPVATDTFTWADLLPPYIVTDTVDGREVFVVQLPEQSADYLLSRLCPHCSELNGQTVVLPPFDFSDSLDIRFPERLYSIEVTETGLDVAVENQLGLDLLAVREPPADSPFLILILRDLQSLATLDSVFLGRGTESLPSGSTQNHRMAIVDETVTQGVRLVVLFHYPGSETAVQVDTTRFARIVGSLDGSQIPAVTLVVDDVEWDDDDEVRLDQNTRDEIVNRFLGGRVDFAVLHDLEATSTLDVSFAATRAQLFSGDQQNEVSWRGLELTSGLIQSFEITTAQVETIAGFPEPFYIGYRGVANGTREGPGGARRLSRIRPNQWVRVSLKLHSRLMVGG